MKHALKQCLLRFYPFHHCLTLDWLLKPFSDRDKANTSNNHKVSSEPEVQHLFSLILQAWYNQLSLAIINFIAQEQLLPNLP